MALVNQYGHPLASTSSPMVAVSNSALNNNFYQWVQAFGSTPFQNPDNLRIEDYERMIDTDETVFSGIEFVTLAALARLGEYTHSDGKIQDLVQESLEKMDDSFANAVSEILTAIWAGYSATEIIWREDKGRVMLGGLQTLHPNSVTLDIGRPGDGHLKNKLKQVIQFYGWGGQHQVNIPVDKCIVYSHRCRFGNLYGKSRLKPAHKSWWLKDVALTAWGLTLQRYGSPHVVGKVGPGNVVIGNQTVDSFTYLSQMIDSLSAKGSLVVDKNTEVDFLWPLRTFGGDFEMFVAYCNKMIYRALLLPSLVADHGSSGSYSLGQQHFDLFALSLEELLLEVTEVLLEQLVRPLIEFNFGPQDDYGEFGLENFQADDEKMLSELFKNLVDAGTIDKTRLEDVNWMRLRVGMPELSPEDFEPSLPEMPLLPTSQDPNADPNAPPANAKVQEKQFSTSWAGRKRRFLQRKFRATAARMAEFRAREATCVFAA